MSGVFLPPGGATSVPECRNRPPRRSAFVSAWFFLPPGRTGERFAPPVLFSSCRKENAPCTVGREKGANRNLTQIPSPSGGSQERTELPLAPLPLSGYPFNARHRIGPAYVGGTCGRADNPPSRPDGRATPFQKGAFAPYRTHPKGSFGKGAVSRRLTED